MLPPQRGNLHIQRVNLLLRLLNRGAAVALGAPAAHVELHLLHAPPLGQHLLAVPARLGLEVGVEHQLEPARLARPVLARALLSEVAPLPPAAGPELVVEVAHGWVVVVAGGCGVGERVVCFLFFCVSVFLSASPCIACVCVVLFHTFVGLVSYFCQDLLLPVAVPVQGMLCRSPRNYGSMLRGSGLDGPVGSIVACFRLPRSLIEAENAHDEKRRMIVRDAGRV